MVETDLSEIKKKRPKIPVSLSLDKENIEFLKKDMENHERVTLSGVFDYWLEKFVVSIKEKRAKEEQSKEDKGVKKKEGEENG